MEWIKRFLPIALIIFITIIAYFLGILNYLSWEQFKAHYNYFVEWVKLHPFESAVVYISVYIFITACSIPGALLMTILAGMLFSQPFSTLYADLGITLGSSLAFLAARSAVGSSVDALTSKFIAKTREGFKANAFAFMLFLRIVPIFPYQLVTLAPAFLNVPFKTFFWGSFLGYLPVAFILTEVGHGLGGLLNETKDLSLKTLLPLHAQLALIALGLFALMLIMFQKHKKRNSNSD